MKRLDVVVDDGCLRKYVGSYVKLLASGLSSDTGAVPIEPYASESSWLGILDHPWCAYHCSGKWGGRFASHVSLDEE